MGNFTNKVLNYRPTWASIQNKPTTISGWLTDVYTKSEVDSIVDDAINDLVNAAPGALDTLNELAAALGDDANFASTVTNSLAGKVSLSGSYSKPAWLTQVAASIVEQSANYRFVTDTEKTTWNGKQDALAGGTNNYLTKWTGTGVIGVSLIRDNGSGVSIGGAPSGFIFDVTGNSIYRSTGNGNTIQTFNNFDGTGFLNIIGSNSSNGRFQFAGFASIDAAGTFAFRNNNGSVEHGRILSNSRFLWKTTTDAGFDFDINGTARVKGVFSVDVPNAVGEKMIRFFTNGVYNYGDFEIQSGALRLNSPFMLEFAPGGTWAATFATNGSFGLGVNPSAFLHIKASSGAAGTAPIKLIPGALLFAPENGALEFDGTNLYFTVGGVRKIFTLT